MKYIILSIALILVLGLGIALQSNVGEEIVGDDTSEISIDTDINDTDNELVVTPDYSDPSFCASLTDLVPSFAVNIDSGDTLTTGQSISGCVREISSTYNNWAPFEGIIGGYRLVASDGSLLDQNIFEVDAGASDWITLASAGEDLPFTKNISFDATGYTSGTIEFFNDNPSGESVNTVIVTLPVSF